MLTCECASVRAVARLRDISWLLSCKLVNAVASFVITVEHSVQTCTASVPVTHRRVN